MAERRGNHPQGSVRGVFRLFEELAMRRVEQCPRPELRWPRTTSATTFAAAGVRLCSGARLQRANARTKTLAGHYEVRREC